MMNLLSANAPTRFPIPSASAESATAPSTTTSTVPIGRLLDVDPVRWATEDLPGRCCRCRQRTNDRIPPYWNPHLPTCTQCAIELNALFDRCGWPEHPETG